MRWTNKYFHKESLGRRVTLGAKGAKCVPRRLAQEPPPGYTLCMQAPAANFKTPDWLRTGPNQSGAGAWVHIVYAGAGAWVHIMYAGAGAWVHILAPFAPSVTRLTLHCTVSKNINPHRYSSSTVHILNLGE